MSEQIQVIRCPHCKEYIDARAGQCRFCHNAIDLATAQVAAETQQRVNAAYNEASWLRNIAGGYMVFFAAQNFLPLLAIGGCIVLPMIFVALPVMLIRWRVRFGRLLTDDPDYARAKQNWVVALLLWLLVPVAWLVLLIALPASR